MNKAISLALLAGKVLLVISESVRQNHWFGHFTVLHRLAHRQGDMDADRRGGAVGHRIGRVIARDKVILMKGAGRCCTTH